MTLEMIMPFGKTSDVKNLCFTILAKEYPLKIIELMNLIKRRYGRSVTFQAVRKALLELTKEGVLVRHEKEFEINKEWIREAKFAIDKLYFEIYEEKRVEKGDAIGDVSVFTFNSLNEMIKFWQDIIDDWFRKFKKGDPHLNVYQGAHLWEALLHLDREQRSMGQLKKKGIVSYILTTGNMPLDKNIRRFYASIGIKVFISPSLSTFDKAYYVATYGALIVQARYPEDLVQELEDFFKKHKTIENMNLKVLSDIVNKKRKMQLTVIKNLEMAKQINASIINQMT
jgi:hypothetical protein